MNWWLQSDEDKRKRPKIYPDHTLKELAQAMFVSEETIRSWRNKRVPAERVLKWCFLTGEKPEEVRPDLYPMPNDHHQLRGVIREYVNRFLEAQKNNP